jgi:hypothetical protein
MSKWQLTEACKAKIPDWNQRWIDIIMSTAPMDASERELVAAAIRGMYAAAKLDEPRIVFVPSPLMAAVVAGAAAGWWWLKENAATYAATRAATYDDSLQRSRISNDVFAIILKSAIGVVGDNAITRGSITKSYNMRAGGNQWASWCCFLSFVRDVVGFSHPSHANYAHYEVAAKWFLWWVKDKLGWNPDSIPSILFDS